MNAPRVDVPLAALLGPEWDRLVLLAYCVERSRQGQSIVDEDVQRLRHVQALVGSLRASGAAWHQTFGIELRNVECDVLAAVAAPEFEPRLGWAFSQLQGGGATPFPSRALLQELLALDSAAAGDLREAVAPESRLRRARLIHVERDGAYQALMPGAVLLARLGGRATRAAPPSGADAITAPATWDDLVLPPDRLAMLREFLLWIEFRATVVDAWGGQSVGGPVALFAGPSGTGKTLAASVIAHQLGWSLYRVDLGRLVSKYVGETEENLNRLFEAAHGEPMVLQFDEADALFAKRGDVKEARDRYANLEVSHLLTRIEAHDGPCILTTNLRRQLDAAFTRRFQVVVEFPRPDRDGRAALWQRLLPPRAPRAADVDVGLLGASVALTGGQIRNAALHAAYLAAADADAIALRHIALGVWRELAKDGRDCAASELGALAAHLPRELADA